MLGGEELKHSKLKKVPKWRIIKNLMFYSWILPLGRHIILTTNDIVSLYVPDNHQ